LSAAHVSRRGAENVLWGLFDHKVPCRDVADAASVRPPFDVLDTSL